MSEIPIIRNRFRPSVPWPIRPAIWSLLFLLALQTVCAGGSRVPSKKVLSLKAEANALYRKKKFADACDLYREIADLDTLDAPARTDLGLCLQNLGKKDSALQVSRDALRLAGRSLGSLNDSDWSNPDLRARKTAYFNLDKLGGPMREPDSGQCETWASFATCSRPFYVCADVGRKRTADGGMVHWSVIRVGLTRPRAAFSVEETETEADLPRPEMRDMEEQTIDGEFESKVRWLNRDSSTTLPLGEILETQTEGCDAGCKKTEEVQSECRVLYFDPCSGVVGLACAIDQGKNQDRILIGEYYLIPAR
jgi:hypothetical protein